MFDSQVTFYPTVDLETTSRFYTEVLKLPLVLDQGTCRIFSVAMHAYMGFCQRDSVAPQEGLIATFVINDVDGWYSRLKEMGEVNFETTPRYNPKFKIYHFYFRDPNGYLLEIQRFDDPRWPQ